MVFPLVLALAAAQTIDPGAPPPDVAQASGPRGTSGEQRYDGVGYAAMGGDGDPNAVAITSVALPPGSFAELTALDTGHTIIALVTGSPAAGGVIAELSPGAAQALGAAGRTIPVRVRSIVPSAQEQGVLRSGRAVPRRLDAPPALLVALRKRLPGGGMPAVSRHQPLAPPDVVAENRPASRQPAHVSSRAGVSYAPPEGNMRTSSGSEPSRSALSQTPADAGASAGWYVQVATLSALDRAQALAASLGGGRIVSTGTLHRVQIGPYSSNAAAEHARDGIARRGYAGARILHADK